MTASGGSGPPVLPGSNTITTSPTNPTALSIAVASVLGSILGSRLSVTRTSPTSRNTIASTLPSCTPDTFTGFPAFMFPTLSNWTFTIRLPERVSLPESHIVPRTKAATPESTRVPTVISCR